MRTLRQAIYSGTKWLLLISAIGMTSMAVAAPFKGKISMAGVDSEPDWPPQVEAASGSPNVLIWMLDDAGFAHLGAYGGLVDTPNIDKLAEKGLRYLNFHSTALCSPSRAALLTGRNHHAVSTGGHSAAAAGYPGYWSRIPESAATMARVLQRTGYSTYALGKWDHLPSETVSAAGPFDHWPSGQGFDRFYGFLAADINNFEPLLWSDHNPIEPGRGDPDYHLTTDMADKAIEWIRSLRGAATNKPFFMYWATGAVHAPHHAPEDYLEKYRGRFDFGWDEARELILERQKKLGIVPADAQLPPRPDELPAWDSLTREEKAMHARAMEAFAAQLDHADHEFGRIIKELKATGELENTIVIVTSDNGASSEGAVDGSYNEYRMFNGLLTDMESNLKYLEKWGGPETYPHFSAGWAMAGNTPFKYYKQTVHSGGVRVPLIISWPQAIHGQGETRSQFHHMNDVMPTILESAAVTRPDVVDGTKQQPVDGISFSYTFEDAAAPTRKEVQYFEMFGNRAIWADGWKAVVVHNTRPWDIYLVKPFEEDIWELYHLGDDFNELENLADQHPAKLEELKELFHAEATRNNVYPLRPQFAAERRIRADQALQDREGLFEYHGEVSRIPERLAPPIFGRDYSITVELGASDVPVSGVIVAMGGKMGGYALYVEDGFPIFVYNYFGEETFFVRSRKALPESPAKLRFEFQHVDDHKGLATLFIDGEQVAQNNIERLAPLQFSISETFDIGQDAGSLVTNEYAENRGRFSGSLEKVSFRINLD